MASHILVEEIRSAKNAAGKDIAYVAVVLRSWDGHIKFEVGVPNASTTDDVLEDVRQRLIVLFRDTAETLEAGPLFLR
jgi:hypothetical protein